MKRKVFVAMVAVAFLAGTASMSYARWRGGGMNRGPGWNCPRGYDYQWNAPRMGPGGGRMGPQMGPGQMPQDPQMWQSMRARNWEIRGRIGEKLQERAWLLQQDPVDRERVAQLNEELAELQAEVWSIGPGAQGRPGPGGSGSWYYPAWQ